MFFHNLSFPRKRESIDYYDARFPIKAFGNDDVSPFTNWLHFKPRNNLSGQIFPFLLIFLVALIVAAAAVISIGESAKAKTCVSNAADAGSLAAASSWAAAFNKLVDRNKDTPNVAKDNFGQYLDKKDTYQYYKRMKDYYQEMRDHYQELYVLANNYLAEALQHSQNAESLAKQALEKIQTPINDCTPWDPQNSGASFNAQAATAALESAKCIKAFSVLTGYMQRITDFFKDKQTENYCEAKDFMDKAYDKSRRSGLSYAFSNSCTPSNTVNEEGDSFGYWLGTGKFYESPSSTSTHTATFKWYAGDTPKCGMGECWITVTLDLPRIESYQLKHTKWNYPQKHVLNALGICGIPIPALKIKDDPFNIVASQSLTDLMQYISEFLTKNTILGVGVYNKTAEGENCCHPPQPPPCAPAIIKQIYDDARALQKTLIEKQSCVVDGLHAINTLLGDNLTIPTLQKWNKDIFDNVWDEKVGAFASIKNCDDVKNYKDENGSAGMMVIDIDSVTLNPAPWTTKCTVRKSCKNLLNFRTNQCSPESWTESTSTSQFDGGDIGAFKDDYYSRIVSTN